MIPFLLQNEKNKIMAKEFKSSKGKTYYLKSRTTKKGNLTYFMTVKLDSNCLERVPMGYEVFEKYDMGTLYVRKRITRQFSKEDIAFIEKELTSNTYIEDYKLDIHGTEIKIYTVEKDTERDSFVEDSIASVMFDKSKIALFKRAMLRYEEHLKIQIEGKKENKEFLVLRYCYRGSVDDWIVIDAGENLQELAKRTIVHLGKESYFELYRIR